MVRPQCGPLAIGPRVVSSDPDLFSLMLWCAVGWLSSTAPLPGITFLSFLPFQADSSPSIGLLTNECTLAWIVPLLTGFTSQDPIQR
jgi:hypothetical protein